MHKSTKQPSPNQNRSVAHSKGTLQAKTQTNKNGLPTHLKSGIESLSGFSMDDVKVHYNSQKPAQLQAQAYAQGSNIHLAPGKEHHLPHEAWHVVQQKQNRVKPTTQLKKGVPINDDRGLEHEADVMGAKAANHSAVAAFKPIQRVQDDNQTIQFGQREKKKKQRAIKKELHGRKQRFKAQLLAASNPFDKKRSIEEAYHGDDFAHTNLKNAWESLGGHHIVELARARPIFPYTDLEKKLSPSNTIVMRAINTGDMYHIRASMVIHSNYKLLIWHVNQESKAQAQMIADLVNDPSRVYYYHSNPPSSYSKTETWATKDIESFIVQGLLDDERIQQLIDDPQGSISTQIATLLGFKDLNGKNLLDIKKGISKKQHSESSAEFKQYIQIEDLLRQVKINELASKYAPHTDEEGKKFEKDLKTHGHFPKTGSSQKFVIVNFRGTGHSGRLGANAPALDTGKKGVQQIIDKVHKALGSDVDVVPMGEEPSSMASKPNLLKYFLWPSVKGSRFRQAALIRYLAVNYKIVGAIGMRSGVMDQLAFSGIKVISIDIGPHKGLADGKLPSLSTSKGWDRGLKLENAYRERYGHIFIEHGRKGEKDTEDRQWKGEFHPTDLSTIEHAITHYFHRGATPHQSLHKSHPFSNQSIFAAFEHLAKTLNSKTIDGYDVIHNIAPYVRHIKMHQNATQIDNKLIARLNNVLDQKINQLSHGQIKDLKWMSNNIRNALINGDKTSSIYTEQEDWASKELGIQNKAQAVKSYVAMNNHYSAQFKFTELANVLDAIPVKTNQSNYEKLVVRNSTDHGKHAKEVRRLEGIKKLNPKEMSRLSLRIKKRDKAKADYDYHKKRLDNMYGVFGH